MVGVEFLQPRLININGGLIEGEVNELMVVPALALPQILVTTATPLGQHSLASRSLLDFFHLHTFLFIQKSHGIHFNQMKKQSLV
jgi:hypothetical protein